MRVLLQGRSTRSVASTPGGDQVHLEQTARALRTYCGVDAVASSELRPSLAGFDAVHLFGIVRPQEVWIQARNARRQGKPILMSPVYCDVSAFEVRDRAGPVGFVARHTSPDVFEALKAAGRALHNREWNRGTAALFARGASRMQREVLRMVDVFLPNSHSEWGRMVEAFAVDARASQVVIVPNGVSESDADVANIPERDMQKFESFRNCVLCVAKLEGRKNQLRLIEALEDEPFRLVLVGPATPNQPRYVAKVLRAVAGAGNVCYLGEVTEIERRALYALARVHVLPSWMETTGLSSLEAAVAGCALVVSPNGDTHEYFRDMAEYCDPGDIGSIRAAVRRAYETGPTEALAAEVRTNFTWQRAAEKTFEAYAQLVG